MDWIVTGASRGIGAALVHDLLARATSLDRFFVLARSVEQLPCASTSAEIIPMKLDLADVDDARQIGVELAARVRSGSTLVHNAGIWPSRRVITNGLETAFAVNCVGPLAFQQTLLDAGRCARVLVVSAGLLIKGRFDPRRTPTGADFSAIRTYCTTKLAQAAAMREIARQHPKIDFALIHPGVANTELGARRGPIGWLLRLVKTRWEPPEACARRIVEVLAQPRWQATAGEAPWFVESTQQPWPDVVQQHTPAVLAAVRPLLARNGRAGVDIKDS